MSKRILTTEHGWRARRDAFPGNPGEGTNWDLIRVYGYTETGWSSYAVIIADDNLFEGL